MHNIFFFKKGKYVCSSVGKFHLIIVVKEQKTISNDDKRGTSEEFINRVYAMGRNNHGQLGVNVDSSLHELIEIESLANKEIVSVKCSEEVSAGISSTGKLYLWGSATDGMIPGKTCDTVVEPFLIQFKVKQKITKIDFGRSFCVALTSKGSIITWGRNDFGQLGRNILNESPIVPTVISKIKADDFMCGREYTIAWNNDGKVFAWGKYPAICPHSDNTDEIFMMPYPVHIESFSVSMENVISASCCYSVIMVLDGSPSTSTIVYEPKEDTDSKETYKQIVSVLPSHFVEAIISIELPSTLFNHLL